MKTTLVVIKTVFMSVFVLACLSLFAFAATVQILFTKLGSNGYMELVDFSKLIPPTTPPYYYAQRTDIPWGPSTINYVTNSVTNSLSAWWTFETNNYPKLGTATQASFAAMVPTTTKDATRYGSVWSNQQSGIEVFDGVDDYFRVPGFIISLQTNTSLYVGQWINPHDVISTNPQAIFGQYTGSDLGGSSAKIMTYLYNTAMFFTVRNDLNVDTTVTSAMSLDQTNTWMYVSSRRGNGQIGLYTNCVLAVSASDTTTGGANTHLYGSGIGAAARTPGYAGGNGGILYFNGEIGSTLVFTNNIPSGLQETNIFNDSCTKYGKSKLLPPQVNTNYYYYAQRSDIPWGPSTINYVTNSVTNAMVAYWTFETNQYGSVSTATQVDFAVSIGTNDAWYEGGSFWSTNGGGSVYFDGIDDYMHAKHAPEFTNTSAFSVAIWQKRLGNFNYFMALFSRRWSTGNVGYEWNLWNYNNTTYKHIVALFAVFGDGAGSTALYTTISNTTPGYLFASNSWEFVVGTYDGGSSTSSISMYTNGVMSPTISRVNSGFTTRFVTNQPTRLGHAGSFEAFPADNLWWNGYLSSPMYFNRALTPTEVTNLYNDSCTKYGKSKLLPPQVNTNYYYAERTDLPWGPSTINYVTNVATNVMTAWWTFETNDYPKLGVSTQANFSPCTNLYGKYQNNLVRFGPVWSNAAGGSVWFDGSDDWYDALARYGLYFGVDRDISIAVWMYPERINNGAGYDMIFGGEPNPYTGTSYLYAGVYANTLTFQYRDTAGSITENNIPIPTTWASNWQHVCWVKRTSTDKLETWTNGVFVVASNDNSTAYMNANGHFTLGGIEFVSGAHYNYRGGIGDVIISSNSTAWSGLVITNLYNDSCSKYGKSKLLPPQVNTNYYYAQRSDIPWGPSTINYVTNSVTNSMAGWYTMEATNYGGAYSGGATQPNFAVWDIPSGMNPSNTHILAQGAVWLTNNSGVYRFNGIDDGLWGGQIFDEGSMTSTVSVGVWVNPKTSGTLVGKTDSSGSYFNWFLWYYGDNDKFRCGVNWLQGGMYCNSSANYRTNTWYFVAMCAGSGLQNLYVDAAIVAQSNSPSGSFNSYLNADFYLGKFASGAFPLTGDEGSCFVFTNRVTDWTNIYNDSCSKYGKSKLLPLPEEDNTVQFVDSYQTNFSDLALITQYGRNRTNVIYRSTTATTNSSSFVSARTFVLGSSLTNTIVLTNDAYNYNRAFYKVGIEHSSLKYTNENIWGVFKFVQQPLAKNYRGAPINYSLLTDATGIQQKAGQQLLSGLVPYVDYFMYRPTNRMSVAAVTTNTIATNAAGVAYWYDPVTAGPSTLDLHPGITVEIVCGATNPARTNMVFTGPVYTTNTVPFTLFRTNPVGGSTFTTYFTWQLPDDGRIRSFGFATNTPTNQLLWISSGARPCNNDTSSKLGFLLYKYSNSAFASAGWIYNGSGASTNSWDGQWRNPAGDIADFSLEPGIGYAVTVGTNHNAIDFLWRPNYYSGNGPK